MKDTPFRVLFRQFLFRIVDLELIAPAGDATKLLGQFAALLITFSVTLGMVALLSGGFQGAGPTAVMLRWSTEHFLISTTMLVVGLFAVLSWDSTFPNRRDVFVLAPLPVRARTLFLAKIAAVGTALALTVGALHCFAGMIWPALLHTQSVAQPTPALTYLDALPPAGASNIEAILRRDLEPALRPGIGALRPEVNGGAVIGVLAQGQRRILAYGIARPDSIFEIGSVSKTFTGLLLGRMAVEERVAFHEPVRALLPRGTVAQPAGREINLEDLATHRSGLPAMPDNFRIIDLSNPMAYTPAELFNWLQRRGVGRDVKEPFAYSNAGFSVLGHALAARAGVPYDELLRREITDPLGLSDTVITLSPDQERRFLPGYAPNHRPARWDMDGFAPAGGIRSTAADLLTYLDAQLHPDKFPIPADLRSAIANSHLIRKPDVAQGVKIALAWIYSSKTGSFGHDGATGGYTSMVFFNPKDVYAGVVLVNQGPTIEAFADVLGDHVRARLAGEPALALDNVVVPAAGGFFGAIRFYAAYWFIMFGSGAFIFCFVLGLQGVTAQLLPRRWFLRVSSFLQMAAFCVFGSGYMLLPLAVTPNTLLAAQNHGLYYWSPTYWFLGLLQQLSGSPAMAPLARRAWVALAAVFTLTATAYLLSYFRTLRQIVEEPDIVSSARGLRWLPRFGGALPTAVTQFAIRTLLRSRQHRMILAFYWGIAAAFVVFIAKSPGPQAQVPAGADPWHQPSVPTILASVIMLAAAIVGIRIVASMPLELRANWIFQALPIRGGLPHLSAARWTFYVLGLAPVWLLSAAVLLKLWPWRPAVGHLVVLALLGSALTELCLSGFHKIPFTCSYLPGKSKANMAVIAFLGFIFVTTTGASYETRALADPLGFAAMVALFAAFAILARWRASSLADDGTLSDLRFEEEEAPAIFALNLHRDGTPPV